jgi:Flp pilus assembly protein TadG
MTRHNRDETGATAVLVTLMATALVGMLTFTADFGMAYANKRQLQTAADAAALGAAGVLANSQKHACTEVLTDAGAAADGEATSQITANTPSSGTASRTSYSATCTSKGIEVAVTVSGTSPTFFGGVLGQSGDYSVARSATAVVEAATSVGSRLRPLALCASDLPTPVISGTVFLLRLPGDGLAPTGSCPFPPNPGNWWTLDCPEEGADDGNVPNGGTSALEGQIRNGCAKPVSIVPGQGSATGAALRTILTTSCASGVSATEPYKCLGGDPGQPDAGKIEQAWQDLINAREESIIPVFCAAPPGLCDQSTVTGTGTGAIFPVHRFVGVTVCAYHFGKQPSKQYDGLPMQTNDPCVPAASAMADIDAQLDDDDRYLVMVFKNQQVSGSIVPSSCKVGDPCDTGVRQVRLIQ